MRVAIISVLNILYSPYIKKYSVILEKCNIDYDVFNWNRLGIEEEKDTYRNVITFDKKSLLDASKIKKISSYFLYRLWLKRKMKEGEYDFLIVLTTQTALLLNVFLLRKYKNKYIFDIRDYTNEKRKIYKKIIHVLVENSVVTSISSKGFYEWLPISGKYIVSHNNYHEHLLRFRESKKEKKGYNISFIGMIRYYKPSIEFIKSISNIDEISVFYIGKGLCEKDLKMFCEKNDIRNVFFKGFYEPKEKDNLYNNVDMINNVFGDDSIETRTLVSNRFYDAIAKKIPILVSKNTFMAMLVEQYDIGLVIDLKDKSFPEKILNYLNSFNEKEFYNNCIRYIEEINNDEKEFVNRIKGILNERK